MIKLKLQSNLIIFTLFLFLFCSCYVSKGKIPANVNIGYSYMRAYKFSGTPISRYEIYIYDKGKSNHVRITYSGKEDYLLDILPEKKLLLFGRQITNMTCKLFILDLNNLKRKEVQISPSQEYFEHTKREYSHVERGRFKKDGNILFIRNNPYGFIESALSEYNVKNCNQKIVVNEHINEIINDEHYSIDKNLKDNAGKIIKIFNHDKEEVKTIIINEYVSRYQITEDLNYIYFSTDIAYRKDGKGRNLKRIDLNNMEEETLIEEVLLFTVNERENKILFTKGFFVGNKYEEELCIYDISKKTTKKLLRKQGYFRYLVWK